MRENNHWDDSKRIARGILHERHARRRVLGVLLVIALGMMAAGIWWLDSWLEARPVLFLYWWAVCGLLTCFVLLFAVYDALRAVKEERSWAEHADACSDRPEV